MIEVTEIIVSGVGILIIGIISYIWKMLNRSIETNRDKISAFYKYVEEKYIPKDIHNRDIEQLSKNIESLVVQVEKNSGAMFSIMKTLNEIDIKITKIDSTITNVIERNNSVLEHAKKQLEKIDFVRG